MFPKIQDILEPGFVEARLHTDLPATHPDFKFNARIQEIRAKYLGAGNIGLPQYVVLSPGDPDHPLAGKTDGSRGGVTAFRSFLESAKSGG